MIYYGFSIKYLFFLKDIINNSKINYIIMIGRTQIHMTQQQKPFKPSLVIAVFLIAAGLILTCLFASNVWYAVTGFVPLADLSPEEISGQCVTFELRTIPDSFATNTNPGGGCYYILWTGSTPELPRGPEGSHCMTMYSDAFMEAVLQRARSNPDVYAFNSLHFSGKIRKMGAVEMQFFTDALLAHEWTLEDIEEYALPYCVDLYPISDLYQAFYIVHFIAGIFLLALGIVLFVNGMKRRSAAVQF